MTLNFPLAGINHIGIYDDSSLDQLWAFSRLPEVGSGSVDVDPSLWSTDQVSISGLTLRFVMICVYQCIGISTILNQFGEAWCLFLEAALFIRN